MVIKCPKCSAEFDVSFDEVAEVKVQCDGCGEKFFLRDALYERGMEFAKRAKELYDAEKDKESIDTWATAKSYFLPAANAGHSGAQYQMGWIYYVGLSVEKNYEKAVEWYQKGANGGDKMAYYHLALCYEYGEGVEKNMAEAVRLMRLSANSGYTPAHNVLGGYYKDGEGVKQDVRMALAWYRRSIVEDGNNWSIEGAKSIFEAHPELRDPFVSGAPIIGEAQFKSGIEEYSSDLKFQAQMQGEPEGAKQAIALLFWYWTNAVMMDDAEKKLYVSYRDSLERSMDEASLNFLLGEYEELNATDDVDRIKSLLRRDQSTVGNPAVENEVKEPRDDSLKDEALEEYVVPDGAPNDRPKSVDMVMDDNPFVMTDGFARRTVACDGCGRPFKAAYRKLVDMDEESTIANAIEDCSYFSFTCPHCGKSNHIQFRMTLYSVMKRYYIRSFDDVSSILSVHRQHSTFKGAQLGFPDEFLPLVRHRLVLGVYGLVDKVAIFEAGLEDYPIESVKQFIIQQQNLGDKILAILFDKEEGDELYFNLYFKDGQSAACHLSKNSYLEVKATFDKMGTFTEGVFRWVDRETMVGQYSDMASWWAGATAKTQDETSGEEEGEDAYTSAAWSTRFANDPQKSEIWVKAARETEAVIKALCNRGGFGRESVSVLHVQRGEVVHFDLPDTDMYETISSKNTSLRHLGKGSLVLTNKRMVFVYSAMVRSINYEDIAVFTTDWLPHAGRVQVSVEKRVRMVQFNTRYPLLCGMVYTYYTDPSFRSRLNAYFKCDETDPRMHNLVGEMLERMSPAVDMEDRQEKERRRQAEERRLAEIRSRQMMAEWRQREEEEKAKRLAARVAYYTLFVLAFFILVAGFFWFALLLFVVGLIIRQSFK